MSAPCASFNSASGELTIGDVTRSLRPKTFLLAQYLAERAGQVVGKEEMLSAIWADSIVEDQAVFQSVNEIRKAFAPVDVIKTFPRRGYTWLVPVRPANRDITPAPGGPTEQSPPSPHPRLAPRFSRRALAVIIGILLVAGGLWRLSGSLVAPPGPDQHRSQSSSHRALLVLPFDTGNLDQGSRWLRYGAMDAVIQQFTDTADLTLFQPDDVLDILQRREDARADPAALFQVSGASTIVAGQLSGVPGEYSLTYTFYERDGKQHGVLHNATIDGALQDMASELKKRLGLARQPRAIAFDEQFTNTLMFNAIQLLAADDLRSATSFLESAVISMPRQPDAYFWLAKAYLMQGDAARARQTAATALGLADSGNHDVYHSRLLYLQGSSMLALKLPGALNALNTALAASQDNEDWLYVAYSKAMLGHYFLSRDQLDRAFALFRESLSYQQMLNCPMGIAQAHLDLFDYYLANEDAQGARESLEAARLMVENRQLTRVTPLLEAKSAKLAAYR